jgi:hypothetical protein
MGARLALLMGGLVVLVVLSYTGTATRRKFMKIGKRPRPAAPKESNSMNLA